MGLETLKTFADNGLQKTFEENGFVKVSILNEVQIQHLKSKFLCPSVNNKRHFKASIELKDFTIKKEQENLIRNCCEPKLKSFMPLYKILFANYLLKLPGGNGEVGIHRDWTYVDESKYTSVNAWTSLDKTNILNGGLKVIPKSHTWPHSIRYTPFDDHYNEEETKKLKEQAISISTLPGDAIIYDSKLIHFSENNQSTQNRLALGIMCIPEIATPLHFYKPNKNQNLVEKYKVDSCFFSQFIPGEAPQGVQKLEEFFLT